MKNKTKIKKKWKRDPPPPKKHQKESSRFTKKKRLQHKHNERLKMCMGRNAKNNKDDDASLENAWNS